ncbi:DoxX family protein, partial [Halobium palmae]
LFAWSAALVELVGGLLLPLGLVTRLAALLAASEMAVATLAVHLGNGFLVSEGGFEFTLVLALIALSLVLTGPGSPSVDRDLLGGRLDPLARSRSGGPAGA